jgi:DNA-binding winged helix-turn-helix (wHTH) protein/Tfp pilus assembly protein PilF
VGNRREASEVWAKTRMEQKLTYKLGEAILDIGRGTLRRGDEIAVMRPKTFQLLIFLARNAGRVLSKDELLEAVWPHSTVTDDSLTQCIRDARKAIGDDRQAIIRTVPRRGYMLQLSIDGSGPARQFSGANIDLDLSQAKAKVAILPFRLVMTNEAMKPIFDGVVEEIAAALAYIKTFAVLGTLSAAALAQLPADDMQGALMGAGVDYVVEGQVEGGAALFKVAVTLSDVRSGRQLLAKAFSFDADGIFAFHQSVAKQVVSTLVVNIESAALQRASPAPASNVEAYIQIMRGIALLRAYGHDPHELNERGREHLRKAIALDPHSGLAHAYLAMNDVIENGSYGTRSVEKLDKALELALRGIALSPNEARCHRALGTVLLHRRDFPAAEAHYKQALELNPYDATTIAQMAWLRAARGHPAEGLELFDWAMRLNPIHPPWYHFARGATYFLLGHYREAIRSLASVPQTDFNRWALLSACHAAAGEKEEAAACASRARALRAGLTIEAIQHDVVLELEMDREELRMALEAAGWRSGDA